MYSDRSELDISDEIIRIQLTDFGEGNMLSMKLCSSYEIYSVPIFEHSIQILDPGTINYLGSDSGEGNMLSISTNFKLFI